MNGNLAEIGIDIFFGFLANSLFTLSIHFESSMARDLLNLVNTVRNDQRTNR